jgi:hypothetical protein
MNKILLVTTKVFFLASSLVACGGGGSGGGGTANPPPVTNVSPGGFWSGVDSNGGEIAAVVTEAGRFHFLSLDDLSQGNGIMSVSNGNNLNGNFQLVTQIGWVFPDGTTLADCALGGTVNERQSMTVTVNCTTTAGLESQATATLDYDAEYERDSSLATISGNFQGLNSVLNIAGDGSIFAQDPVTGCVINGQVQVINASFNVYDIEFAYSSCIGEAAVLNDSSFVGLAALDNTVNPEELIVAATGDVTGILISFIQWLPRT